MPNFAILFANFTFLTAILKMVAILNLQFKMLEITYYTAIYV